MPPSAISTMRFSGRFKASGLCQPSPDGQRIASVLPLEIQIRSVDRLDEVAAVVDLPPELPHAAAVALEWSPSSQRVLVASPDRILVAAAVAGGEQPVCAQIANPSLPPAADRQLAVGFGSSDDQVWACSPFGIKLSIFDLKTGRTTELLNPKFFKPAAVARRGLAFRPGSRHLALLTRTAGKDWVSVHDPVSLQPVASWSPTTVDAQGLAWSPDGHWLAVWEAPAYGHKVVFYTPEGHLFKAWTGGGGGSSTKGGRAKDERGGREDLANETPASPAITASLGPGVRRVQFSANGRMLAVGDASRCIHIIGMPSAVVVGRLLHPATLTPQANPSCKKLTVQQVWQEQIDQAGASRDAAHHFVEAAQTVSPPGRAAPPSSDATAPPAGCSLLAFDCSSALLATRLEDAPSTVWVWDVETAQLRAVMMFHASVSSAAWHPDAPQTLLVTCDGDSHRGLGVVWSPLCGPPQVANFSPYCPVASSAGHPSAGSSLAGKHRLAWLQPGGLLPPTLFYADGAAFMLAALDTDDGQHGGVGAVPWPAEARARDESPLELVPAGADTDGDSELEDTFLYKRDD